MFFILRRGGEEIQVSKSSNKFRVVLIEEEPVSLDEVAFQTGGTITNQNLGEITITDPNIDATQAIGIARRNPGVRYASWVYTLKGNVPIYLNEQITVVFTGNSTSEQRAAIANDNDLVAPTQLEEDVFVFEISMSSEKNPIEITNQLFQDPLVIDAEPSFETFVEKNYVPTDPRMSLSWHQQPVNATNIAVNSDIKVDKAWEITRGIRSIKVAVIDDGFDLGHPDLDGLKKIFSPLNLRQGEKKDAPIPTSNTDDHGTPCAAIIVGEENGIGAVGIAPGCSLIPIKSSGYLSDRDVEAMFNHVRLSGAAVCSCSWSPSVNEYPLSIRQARAITRAAREGNNGKGCVIFFSAGNINRPVNGVINEKNWSPDSGIDGDTVWHNGFGSHSDVMCVASITSLNKKSLYSSWGKEIALCAPSGDASANWGGQMPNPSNIWQFVQGVGVPTADRQGIDGYDTGDYCYFNGTSCACPVAAGVAALVLSANPTLTAAQVRQIMKDTSEKISDPSTDPQLGLKKGTYTNGHSEWHGYGRVNAEAAVKKAISTLPVSGFNDITGHPFTQWILVAKNNNWASGYSDGTFKPNGLVSRAALAAMIYAAFRDRPFVRPAIVFSDIPSNHWAAEAINFAYRAGFMSGFPDGTFRANSNATKLQVILAIRSGNGFTGGSTALVSTLKDSQEVPTWAISGIGDAIFNKLIVNYPAINYLRPNEPCLRCEAIAAIVQAKIKMGAVTPIDNDFIL